MFALEIIFGIISTAIILAIGCYAIIVSKSKSFLSILGGLLLFSGVIVFLIGIINLVPTIDLYKSLIDSSEQNLIYISNIRSLTFNYCLYIVIGTVFFSLSVSSFIKLIFKAKKK